MRPVVIPTMKANYASRDFPPIHDTLTSNIVVLHSNGKKLRRATAKGLKVLALSTKVCARELRNCGGAHCYSCKSLLTNATELECASCGWILCKCGACGCGYVTPNNSMQPTAFGGG
jgi:hypothetical protein